MASVRYVILQLWQDHRKMVLVLVVVAWIVFIVLFQQRLGARKNADTAVPQGTVVKILPVGGLPVT